MKIMIASNGPMIATGYGVQCRNLATRLAADGHEVAILETYGHNGPILSWTSPLGDAIPLYPGGYLTNADDMLTAHFAHFVNGDPKGGWLITLADVWSFRNPELATYQVASWAPVDHVPIPPAVVDYFHRSGAVAIAMSEDGRDRMLEVGLNPAYIPLAVDTSAYRPTPTIDVGGKMVSARKLFDLPDDAFVVGMVAMNKGWSRDRKGFNEAFRAFGRFWQSHQNAVLFVHAEKTGAAEGINLVELAIHAGIPHHAVVWSDQYAYRLGLPAEMMAAAYTAMDVLLAPSHGEGFCVPLIEAQACGTPVIVSDFSSQKELVGAGWKVMGQLEWDPAQRASYICPYVVDVYAKLEEAYKSDLVEMQAKAIAFARDNYDWDHVYDVYWRPFLKTLEPVAPAGGKPLMDSVDVIVPAMRVENLDRFAGSLHDTKGDANVRILYGEHVDKGDSPKRSYAENVNRLVAATSSDWVLIVGDDVEFKPGWFEAARALSDRFDVIGTNDSEPGRVRNPDVARGHHADHFFVRRSYIDDEGASLDGPGVLMPECYRHWWVDREVIGLAKARGVFTPCLDSVIVHHHPGFDGREDLRQGDPTYSAASDAAEQDRRTFMSRVGMIEGHRVTRGR